MHCTKSSRDGLVNQLMIREENEGFEHENWPHPPRVSTSNATTKGSTIIRDVDR